MSRGTGVETMVVDGVATVAVSGPFDAETTAGVVDGVLAAIGGRVISRLTVDMSEAGFVDSTGLGTLVRLRLEARRHGARTVLVGLDPRLEKLLRLTGLDDDFLESAHPRSDPPAS